MADITNVSLDQKRVLRDIAAWYKNPIGSYLTVGGYAGTGKTTLISVFRKLLHKHRPHMSVAFATYTGKASQVLANKLKDLGALHEQDSCGTIHSLMYRPNVNAQGHVTGWYRNKDLKYDLIIIDEASMVTSDLWHDLQSYKLPILAVGDHGQLPPIGDDFNLMENPQLVLQRIHRQAENSPIIQMATQVRLNGTLPVQDYAHNARKLATDSPDAGDVFEKLLYADGESLLLCARNKTRIKLNNHIRAEKYFESDEPLVNDTVICLKNNYNNKDGPIFNGMIGYVKSIKPKKEHWYEAKIDFPNEGRSFEGEISRYQFNSEQVLNDHDEVPAKKLGERFDFGYALTVHKAQGSQAQTVVVYEEGAEHWMKDNYARWLYTAITRASENIYIIA